MNRTDANDKKNTKEAFTSSLLLLLVALVSITAATAAWFSISSHTRVRSMAMDITTGVSLRFDLDKHENFDDYAKTLSFTEISDRILRDTGTDIREIPLEPVTTDDCEVFTLENGEIVDPASGKYIEFVLHFMAQKDMYVHLTSVSGEGQDMGTLISSENDALAQTMRIGFDAAGEHMVYDPNLGDEKHTNFSMQIFGIPSAEKMVYNENNMLFFAKEGVDIPVTVHIWVEGTDERCVNDIIGEKYELRLRFEGRDIDGNDLISR